ncbi:hypothetical protein AgCh_014282 [Apium graveolens]
MLTAKRDHRISFIPTPQNIERLPKVPSDLKPLIDLSSVAMTKYQIRTAPNLEDDGTENVSDQYRLGMTIRNCDMVAIRSSVEFEPEWFNLRRSMEPLLPVGLLPVKESTFRVLI